MSSEIVATDVKRTAFVLSIVNVKADSQRAELLCRQSLGSIYTKISFAPTRSWKRTLPCTHKIPSGVLFFVMSHLTAHPNDLTGSGNKQNPQKQSL